MKALIKYADCSKPKYIANIRTLKDLKKLYELENHELVISFEDNSKKGYEIEVMVYNDYIE